MEEVFDTLSQFDNDGRINYTGVSNFSIERLEWATDAPGVPIATDQVQYIRTSIKTGCSYSVATTTCC